MVQAPTAISGTTSLTVEWKEPLMPNGQITGYFLYQDSRQIYSGAQMLFDVQNLQVCEIMIYVHITV